MDSAMDFPGLIPILLVVVVFCGIALWNRSFRSRVDASVRAIAADLSLPERAGLDRRMRVHAGPVLDLQVEIASHAWLSSVLGNEAPEYANVPSFTLRVVLAHPLPLAFRLDTSRGAEQLLNSTDLGLDMAYKAGASSAGALKRLLGPAPLRESINALVGTGRVVVIDESSVRVCQSEPRPAAAVALAQAAVRVARLLQQRAAFQTDRA